MKNVRSNLLMVNLIEFDILAKGRKLTDAECYLDYIYQLVEHEYLAVVYVDNSCPKGYRAYIVSSTEDYEVSYYEYTNSYEMVGYFAISIEDYYRYT